MRTAYTMTVMCALALFVAGLLISRDDPPPQPEAAIVTGTLGPSVSAWKIERTLSPIDDSENVDLEVASREQIPGKFGGVIRIRLGIRCREGRSSVAVNFGDHFMTSGQYGDWGNVTYRVDHAEAVDAAWVHSPDHAELMTAGSAATALSTRLASASTFVLRAAPFGELPVTATFDVSGLADVMPPLRTACRF